MTRAARNERAPGHSIGGPSRALSSVYPEPGKQALANLRPAARRRDERADLGIEPSWQGTFWTRWTLFPAVFWE
jgi:hypothetical protein